MMKNAEIRKIASSSRLLSGLLAMTDYVIKFPSREGQGVGKLKTKDKI
jgi:hypothetical protein